MWGQPVKNRGVSENRASFSRTKDTAGYASLRMESVLDQNSTTRGCLACSAGRSGRSQDRGPFMGVTSHKLAHTHDPHSKHLGHQQLP